MQTKTVSDSVCLMVSGSSNHRHHFGRSRKLIGILVYDDCSFLDVALVLEAFELANVLAEKNGDSQRYCVTLLSSRGSHVRCSNSMQMKSTPIRETLVRGYEALFIAGGKGANQAAQDRESILWLQDVFHSVKIVQAAREGISLLRSANLPESRGTILQARGIAASQSATLADGLPFSSAGDSSLLLTAFCIIKSDLGPKLAESIAEKMIPFIGQSLAPLFFEPSNANMRSTIRRAARWIDENCDRPLTIADAAQSVLLGERTFLRHFKTELAMPPSEYLMRARLNNACRLLLTSTLPIEKIARICGLGTGARMAKIFKRRLGISASDFRSGVLGEERREPLGGVAHHISCEVAFDAEPYVANRN